MPRPGIGVDTSVVVADTAVEDVRAVLDELLEVVERYDVDAVHLVAHAAMKSSLFLGAGVFQHARGSTAFEDLEGVGRGRRWTFAGFALAG